LEIDSITEDILNYTNFFSVYKKSKYSWEYNLQNGVSRTNCIDCIDTVNNIAVSLSLNELSTNVEIESPIILKKSEEPVSETLVNLSLKEVPVQATTEAQTEDQLIRESIKQSKEKITELRKYLTESDIVELKNVLNETPEGFILDS